MFLCNLENQNFFLTDFLTVVVFVSSLLDNFNSLLFGVPIKSYQNYKGSKTLQQDLSPDPKKQNHITPILRTLHWLPIKSRIQFKILLLTFNAVHGFSPHYISELVSPYLPARSLRSSTQHLLLVTKQKTNGAFPRVPHSLELPIFSSLPIKLWKL